jgi:hypothetical protein
MSMELEEMKQAWAEMNLRQDGIEALLRADYRERRADRTRGILRWSLLGGAIELMLWIGFTVFAASFWVEHRHVLQWLVIGLLLHAYGIAGIWSTTTRILLMSRIYLFDAPVVLMQKRLAQLRRFGVVSTLALGLPWWCLWLLVPMAAACQWAGADWLVAGSAWFWATMAVGVAGMAGSVWLARRIAARPQRSAFVQRLIDDMSGYNLRRAERQLDELARFEHG